MPGKAQFSLSCLMLSMGRGSCGLGDLSGEEMSWCSSFTHTAIMSSGTGSETAKASRLSSSKGFLEPGLSGLVLADESLFPVNKNKTNLAIVLAGSVELGTVNLDSNFQYPLSARCLGQSSYGC